MLFEPYYLKTHLVMDKHVSEVGGLHLQDELHHLCVDQPVHRFPVYVSDEVTGAETAFLGGTPVLHMLRSEHRDIYYTSHSF